jgi:hypothetical protein
MAIQQNIHQKMLSIIFLLITFNLQAMTNHLTTIEVLGKKPHQIYDFMFGLDRVKYVNWHSEHKDFRIVKETKDTIGSVFFFHEKMGNLTVKYNWEIIKLLPNKAIVMKAQYFIPVYLVLTFGETPNGTLVTHDLQIGNKQRPNAVLDFFIRNFIFTASKQQHLTRHAIEEFKNLEQLLY